MTFRVIIDPSVSKKAKKFLKPAHLEKLRRFVRVLEENPVPSEEFDVKRIRGQENLFRLRLGKFRVLYVVFWKDKVIVVKDIQPRESAYKRF